MKILKRIRLWFAPDGERARLTPGQQDLIEQMDEEYDRVFGPEGATKQAQAGSGHDARLKNVVNVVTVLKQNRHYPSC